MFRFSDVPISRFSDVPISRFSDVPIFRCPDLFCAILQKTPPPNLNGKGCLPMSAKALRELDGENDVPTSNEDFPALEEKIYKAIEQLKAARAARAAAERSVARLREQIDHRAGELDSLRTEV